LSEPLRFGFWESRARVYERIGDFPSAIADYSQLIRSNPQHAPNYYNRGGVRVRQRDLTGAMADFNEAIRIDPNDFRAYMRRGRFRETTGDRPGAKRDYQRAADIAKQKGQGFYGFLKEAQAALQRVR
jgi:tetratricopeptide (TPR) repeat protein